jgi:hypothetical protein
MGRNNMNRASADGFSMNAHAMMLGPEIFAALLLLRLSRARR